MSDLDLWQERGPSHGQGAPDDALWQSQWRLARVEVVNWGTLSGHHRIEVAREGHLVTGASGSGKSSLLDAIAAVLTPDKWLNLNAAAQDGGSGRSDRTLVSYVRGAWSKEADELEDRTVSSYLRPAATWGGILLRYEDLSSAPVTLVRLFHLRGTGTDIKALSDACMISRDEVSLADLKDYAARGIDVRRLKADLSPVVVTSNRTHGPFYVRLRSLLGIGSDNALKLLHRTQAAKNLGTLDRLFREFMLDEPTTFSRADNAVEQFDELDDAYAHVVDLRKQRDMLARVAAAADEYETASAQADESVRMQDLVSPYAAEVKRGLAQDALHDAEVREESARQVRDQARAAAGEAEEVWEAARRASEQAGGVDAHQLRARIDDHERQRDQVAWTRARFAARLASVAVDTPGNADEYAELLVAARRELAEPEPAKISHELSDAAAAARKHVHKLESELAELRNRRSNLSGKLLRVRAKLAQDLRVPETALPFGGELIEVRPEHAEWAGAIERVLAPLAQSLLVPDDLLPAVRRLVDGWYLGTRLVIDAVPAESDPPPRSRDARSVVRRVEVATGRFEQYLQRRLGTDFDVACVEGPDALDEVPRGITRAGLYKRGARGYEKNDAHEVDDRAQWMLGGNNDAKVELLMERLGEARLVHEHRNREVDAADARRQAAIERRTVLRDVVATEYAQIDVAAVEARLTRLRADLEALVHPDSDLARALEAEREARASLDGLRGRAQAAETTFVEARAEHARLADLLADLTKDRPAPLTSADAEALRGRFAAVRRSLKLDTVDQVATLVATALSKEAQEAEKAVRAADSAFVGHATRYQAAWQTQAADLTPTIEDRDGYRDRLGEIIARGLPDHEANFLRLLRDRSRDTLIHLREEIYSAPRRVEERVDPVNESLRRSRFDVATHLEIRVKVRRTGEVDDFLKDLAAVVDGSFADESLADAEKRFAVLRRIMTRLASSESADRSWKKRVLDTREHVSFLAREYDDGGETVSVHDSSAGLSGGQRQRLVVFCLAAALRYQLTDHDEDTPRYGTIVLDEAFDKSDAQYTRIAMDIFREFGFHMVLATPQKLLQTLEPYIGAVTSVANPTRRESTLAHVPFTRVDV